MANIKNAFSPTKASKIIPKGNQGYDNPRENIDPHVKTKVLDTKELIIDGVTYTPGGAPEGTAVLSTGELGASKFLREDGDDTCSWQSPAGGGDVTAAANLTNNTIVQGDGGAKGVKTSTATVAQIATNVTHSASNGTDHANVVTNDTHVAGNGADHANVALNDTHRADNSQAHTDYLINTGSDSSAGQITADGFINSGDRTAVDVAYVPMVLFNTDAAPPAASGFVRGTIYIQYTA